MSDQIERLANDAAKLMAKRHFAKNPPRQPPEPGKYGLSNNGTPLHYDPNGPPVVDSTCPTYAAGMSVLSEEEHLNRRFTIYCQVCPAVVSSRKDWKQHNAEEHDGRAMWANTPHGKPIEVRYRAHGARADGEILLSSVDGSGKVIRCRTAAQARREAARHNCRIIKGVGAD